MTKLPVVDFKRIEKRCSVWVLFPCGKKAAMFFIGIPTEDQPRCQTTREEISRDR